MAQSDGSFELLLEYLNKTRGFDFSTYKRPSLERRLQRRMQTVGIETYPEYQDYLEVHPHEFTDLFNSLLINVTGFFRDDAPWEYVSGEVIPRILEGKQPSEPIRVWSAGCASGEEPYSIAMALAEKLGTKEFLARVKIYATDLDEDALSTARQAQYSPKAVEGVPPHLLDKYFTRQGDKYVFNTELRRAVIFGRHDLTNDSPISRVDLLICRNAIMYFNAEAQGRILDRFYFALNPSGFLFLGKAEMLLLRTDTFQPVDLKQRIFMKAPRGNMRDRLLVTAQAGRMAAQVVDARRDTVQLRIHEVSFDQDPVAQLVVDATGTLVLANERARVMFSITQAHIGSPLQDLEVSYRPVELRSRIEQAYTQRSPVVLHDIEWRQLGTERRSLDVHIGPVVEMDGSIIGIRCVFSDTTRYRQLQEELEYNKQELETAYEELQSANEELTTTNEELQSTVEELETTNEELQSTNEELETMNEELQSTNEELETINREIVRSGDELNRTNTFLGAILTSLNSGVVVLDTEMRVLIWNSAAEELWGLRQDEVNNKHLLNLDIGLPVDKLRKPLRQALAGNSQGDEIILMATNRRGKPIQCRVRCMPMKQPVDGNEAVSGVIVLMDEEKVENQQLA